MSFSRIAPILLPQIFLPWLALASPPDFDVPFQRDVLPILQEFCAECHDGESENKAQFMVATSWEDVSNARGSWRNVANQLVNRTMPPVDEAQPSEADRIRIAHWIAATLRETACAGEEYAGVVTTRRLNRREYANTIRDLMGVELDLATTLPVDSGGGEGFDNNGETLFLPPLLLERYIESAQRVLDAAIIPPPMSRLFLPKDMLPDNETASPLDRQQEVVGDSRIIQAGKRVSILVPIPVGGDYKIPVGIVPLDTGDLRVGVEVDDIPAAAMTFRRYGGEFRANQEEVKLRLTRGLHKLSIRAPTDHDVSIVRIRVARIPEPTTPTQVARHIQLLGVQPARLPANQEQAAKQTIRRFVSRAFRRPASDKETARFYKLFESTRKRGDSYEESIKLAMKAVLVAPEFLFRIESPPTQIKPEPLDEFELATRLSYFLWSTTPDRELSVLAGLNQLSRDDVLNQQVDRMLENPRSREFFRTFVGQWWGTRDLGGRRAATENSIQNIYTPFIAADMREQAVLLFEHIIRADRSILELLDSDYTFLTGKLAKFYGIERSSEHARDEFQRVQFEDAQQRGRYGGILGLGGVLTLTSHISERQTSPVLRGAWVLDTLFGTRVPSPPDNVPALDKKRRKQENLTLRETLELHREDKSCAACHKLMDPIGFGLENFDFLGRWREDENGNPIDSLGRLPSGEVFHGPAELKQMLLKRKSDFSRQLVRKLLGYALGRSLVDADECTIERLVTDLQDHDYRGRSLLKAIVQSVPFRNKSLPQRSNP